MNLITDGGEAEGAVCSVGDECSSAPRGAEQGPLLHDECWSPVYLSVNVITILSGVSGGRRVCTGVSHAKVYTTEPQNNFV